MAPADGERIAENTEAIRGLREDVQGFGQTIVRFGERIGKLESCMGRLVAQREQAEEQAEHRRDAISLWLRAVAVVFAGGSLLVASTVMFATFYFHH